MDLVKLKEKYPNDMELGKEVRKYIDEHEEIIKYYLSNKQE